MVSFDSFPLFLHVPTSLIKLIPWLNFSTNKRQAEDMEGSKDHGILPTSLPFPKPHPLWESKKFIVDTFLLLLVENRKLHYTDANCLKICRVQKLHCDFYRCHYPKIEPYALKFMATLFSTPYSFNCAKR